MNRVQLQPGLSIPEVYERSATEAKCFAADLPEMTHQNPAPGPRAREVEFRSASIISAIEKIVGLAPKLVFGAGFLLLVLYGGEIGRFPAGLTVGDSLALIMIALAFGFFYTLMLGTAYVMVGTALRVLAWLSIPLDRLLARRYGSLKRLGGVRAKTPQRIRRKKLRVILARLQRMIAGGRVSIRAAPSASRPPSDWRLPLDAVGVVLWLLFFVEMVCSVELGQPLSWAAFAQFLLVGMGMNVVLFGMRSGMTRSTRTRELPLRTAAFVLLLCLTPLLMAADLRTNLIHLVMRTGGFREDAVIVQVPDTAFALVREQVKGEFVGGARNLGETTLLGKANVLLGGLGTQARIEIMVLGHESKDKPCVRRIRFDAPNVELRVLAYAKVNENRPVFLQDCS